MKSDKKNKIFYPDFFNDVFGPIMQPGSSGGFAGTNRCARAARYALKSEPVRAKILFNPSEKRMEGFGNWMEDRAYLGGIMDYAPDDVELFDAHNIARSKGLSYEFGNRQEDYEILRTTTFRLEGTDGDRAELIASSIGGGMVRIYEINGFKVDWQGDTYAALIWSDEGNKEYEEAQKTIADLLGRDFVCAEEVTDHEGRKALFLESSVPLSSEIKAYLDGKQFEYRAFIALLPVVTIRDRKEQLFTSVDEWQRVADERNISALQAAIEYEKNFSGWSDKEIWDYFEKIVDILNGQIHAFDNLGVENIEDTKLLPVYGKFWNKYLENGRVLSDTLTKHIIWHALATNAKVPGVKIVPGPMGTGGGYLFSALDAVREERGFSHERLVEALIIAAGFGVIAFTRSNPSGERGCVGESGICSAMASAAVAYLAGGDLKEAENAASMALQASFGITCDAIAGGLEFPCITRTVRAAVTAPLYADLALAGIDPLIPYHEAVDAMELHYKRSDKKLLAGPNCGLNCTPTAGKCKCFIDGEVMSSFIKYEAV